MTKSQKTKLRNIKIMKERKKLFGGKDSFLLLNDPGW